MHNSNKGNIDSTRSVNNMCPHNTCPNNPNKMYTGNECMENPMKENIMAVVEIFFGPEGKPRVCTEFPIRLEIAIIAIVLSAVIEEKICD